MTKFTDVARKVIDQYDSYEKKYEISDEISKLFSNSDCKIMPQKPTLLCLTYKSVNESNTDKYTLKDIQNLLAIPDWQLRRYIKNGLLKASSIYTETCDNEKKGNNPGKSGYSVSKQDLLRFIVENQSIILKSSYFAEKEYAHEVRRCDLLEKINEYIQIAKSLYKTENFLEKKELKKQMEAENFFSQIRAIEMFMKDLCDVPKNSDDS